MKNIILAAGLAFGIVTLFVACEKNDYQHPMHRK
jgi:hypothetical protein